MSSVEKEATIENELIEDENVSETSNESAVLQNDVDDSESENELEISLEKSEEIENLFEEEGLRSQGQFSGDFAENGDSPDVQEEEEETVAPEEVPEKSKTARNIRAPSRYDDCMLDISHVPESLPEEVSKSLKKEKSVKFAVDSVSQDGADAEPDTASSPTPSSDKKETGESLFDAEGNFRFKLEQEHIILSRTGGLNSYRCDICEMIFPRSFSLRRHYERIHINPRFVRNKGKKDQEMVRKLIDNDRKNDLMRRNKAVMEVKDGSKEESECAEEEKQDENKIEDPSFYVYACKLCARPQIFFKTKDLLRRHYHTRHTAIARIKSEAFKCETCDRSYSTRHELHRHRRSHSGERPYACRYCGKRFPTSTNARRHERTHTGDRPHLCKVCGKGFIQKTDMSKHLRSVHRLKPIRPKGIPPSLQDDFVSENREVSGENQFEENIDFAAYLNLDQFEKGSLMGGSEVEAQFLNSSPNNAGSFSERRNLEKEEEHKFKDSEVRDDQEDSGVLHKCPECVKTFSSKVNMRRHFRLKHERNQAVRSALPVSMVVRKFKIQEPDEVEAKDGLTALKQESEFASTKILSPGSNQSSSPLLKSISQPQDHPVVSSSPKPVSSVNTKPSFLKGSKSGKQGSKLGMILDRLTMKKASEEKPVDRPLSDVIRPVRKENLISSDTLLQSMQPAKKKLQVPKPSESLVKSSQTSQSPKPKEALGSEQKFSLLGNKSRQLDQVLRDKFRREELFSKRRQDRKVQSYIKNRMFERGETSKRVFPSLRSGFLSHHSTRRDPPRGPFAARNLYSDRSRSLHQGNRESSKKDFLKDRNSKQISSVFNSAKDPSRSFLDNCWSNKMNNLSENKSSFPQSRSWKPPDYESRKNSDHPFPFQQQSPFVARKSTDVGFSAQSPTQSTDVGSSRNAPLDLTKKIAPKSASSDYAVTDEGVLDLSTPKHSMRPIFDIAQNKRKQSLINKYDISEDVLGRERILGNHPSSHPFLPQRDFDSVKPDLSNMSDDRDLCYPPGNIPLKFHPVKFSKSGQALSSGASGRPTKAFANSLQQLRRFPSEINPPSMFNDPFQRPFMKPQTGVASRNRVFPQRQKHHHFSPYNKYERDPMGQQRQRPFLSSASSILPSSNEMLGFSKSDQASSFQRSGPRYPYMDARSFPHSPKISPQSLQKRLGTDLPRRRSQEPPSIMGNLGKYQGASRTQGRKSFDDFDEDVMKRCIRKAQHELNRTSTNQDSSRRLSSEASSISNLHQRKVKEEPFADARLNSAPYKSEERTSPVPFLQSQKLLQDSRSKLTMTPGFDTNGDDSSKDDDVQPQVTRPLLIHSKRSKEDKLSASKSSGEKLLSEVSRIKDLGFSLREKTTAVKQADKVITSEKFQHSFVQLKENSEANEQTISNEESQRLNTGKPLVVDFSGSSKDKTPEKGQKHAPGFNRTSADQEIKSEQTSHSGSEETMNSPSKSQNESTFQPIQSPTDDSTCQPKKFVQKIKLRAIKSQDKHGAKKWTLVGDNPMNENNEEPQANEPKEEKNYEESEGTRPIKATEDGNVTTSPSPKQKERILKATPPKSKQHADAKTTSPATTSPSKFLHSSNFVSTFESHSSDAANKKDTLQRFLDDKKRDNLQKSINTLLSSNKNIKISTTNTKVGSKPQDSNEIKETCLNVIIEEDDQSFLQENHVPKETLKDQTICNMQETDSAELCDTKQNNNLTVFREDSDTSSSELLKSGQQLSSKSPVMILSVSNLSKEKMAKPAVDTSFPNAFEIPSLSTLPLKESMLCKPAQIPSNRSDASDADDDREPSLLEIRSDSSAIASTRQSITDNGNSDKDEITSPNAAMISNRSFDCQHSKMLNQNFDSRLAVPRLSNLAEKMCDSNEAKSVSVSQLHLAPPNATPNAEPSPSACTTTDNSSTTVRDSTIHVTDPPLSKTKTEGTAEEEVKAVTPVHFRDQPEPNQTLDSESDKMLDLSEVLSTPSHDDESVDQHSSFSDVGKEQVSSSIFSTMTHSSISLEPRQSTEAAFEPCEAASAVETRPNLSDVIQAKLSSVSEPSTVSTPMIHPDMSNELTDESAMVSSGTISPVIANKGISDEDGNVVAPLEPTAGSELTAIDSSTNGVGVELSNDVNPEFNDLEALEIKETDSRSESESTNESSLNQTPNMKTCEKETLESKQRKETEANVLKNSTRKLSLKSSSVTSNVKISTCAGDVEQSQVATAAEVESTAAKELLQGDSYASSVCEPGSPDILPKVDETDTTYRASSSNTCGNIFETAASLFEEATSFPSTDDDSSDKQLLNREEENKSVELSSLHSQEALRNKNNVDANALCENETSSFELQPSQNDLFTSDIAGDVEKEKETTNDLNSKPTSVDRPIRKPRKFKRLFTRKKSRPSFLSKNIGSAPTFQANVAQQSSSKDSLFSAIPVSSDEATSYSNSSQSNTAAQTKLPRSPGRPRKIKRRRLLNQRRQPSGESLDAVDTIAVQVSPSAKKAKKEKVSSANKAASSSGNNDTIDKSNVASSPNQSNSKNMKTDSAQTGTSGPVLKPNKRIFKQDTRGRKKMINSRKEVTPSLTQKNQTSFENRKRKQVKTRSFETPAESSETPQTQPAGRGQKRLRGTGRGRGLQKSVAAAGSSVASPITPVAEGRGTAKKVKRHMPPASEQAKRGKKRGGKRLMPVRRSIRNYEKIVVAKK